MTFAQILAWLKTEATSPQAIELAITALGSIEAELVASSSNPIAAQFEKAALDFVIGKLKSHLPTV